jgi:GAF domain-containing protein
MNQRQMQQLLRRIETRADRFRNSLENALDRSPMNGTARENEVNKLLTDFEQATDQMRDRFNSNSLSAPDVEFVLQRAALLDSPPEEQFDRLARLAARVVNAPVALVSGVDRDRQFFKACIGLAEPWASQRETPLSHSFCQHAVATRRPLIVDDAREDPTLRENAAIRDLDVIAYAGIPLIDSTGQALGTLCVIDSKPRHWRPEETALLEEIAHTVVAQIEAG